MLSIEQAAELINLKNELRLEVFFQKAREYKINTPELSQFEQEFISGRYAYDYYSRLHAYVNFYAHTQIKEHFPDKFDIFFSFSSKNKAQAEKIVADLRSEGFSVFFSNYDLSEKAGEDFFLAIDNALKNCKHLVLYCTPDAMNSKWVNNECKTFFSQKYMKDGAKHYFFIVEGNKFSEELIPMLWRNIQRVRTSGDILQKLRGNSPPKADYPKGNNTTSAPNPVLVTAVVSALLLFTIF